MAGAATITMAGDDPAGAGTSRVRVADVVQVVRDRRGLIFTIAAIVVALTAIVLMILPTMYSASAVVMLESRRNNVADATSVLTALPTDPTSVQNQIQILTSRDLASRVVDRLGLDNDPEFAAGGWFSAPDYAAPGDVSVAQHERTVSNFLKRLSVESEGLSTAITVRFSARSPEKAAQIANAIAETYVESSLQTKFQATKEATGWLEGRVRELSRQVQADDAAVERYKAEHNITETNDGIPLIDQQISAINSQLVAARADLAQKQATYERVDSLMKQGHGADISQAVASPLIIQLRTQEADLIKNEADLETRYGPKHPKLIAAEQQKKDIEDKISEEVSRLAGSLANDVSVARANVASIQESLSQSEQQAGGQNMLRVKLKTLEVNSASTHAIYDSFVQRLRAIQDQDAIQASDASVISHASVPIAPSSPHRTLILLAAIPAGLLVGVLIALLTERFGPAFQSLMPRNVLRGVPVLAEIPGVAHARAADLVTDWPDSDYARAVGQLAHRIAYGAARGGPRVITVTSPQSGEGAATVALSLARAASRMGRRTIVIDGNIAQPTLAPLAGYKRLRFGLTEVLGGRAPLNKSYLKDPRSNALMLSPAQARGDAYRIAASGQMAQLLGHLRGSCDLLIVNAPPVLSNGGASAIARYSDAVMLVTRTDVGPRPAVAQAIDTLARASSPPIGIVLAS
ncbi:MAG TPA: polysaccharide biosynthesis tyrosine autokinase [Rhizomicrobium sp.]|nr:polysaccharide biosynthesis tyrosine autokinase [Rhizomicrobium sp.]